MCPNQKKSLDYKTLWKKEFHKVHFELKQNNTVAPVHIIILNFIEKFHQQNGEDEKNLDYSTGEILQLHRKSQSPKKFLVKCKAFLQSRTV